MNINPINSVSFGASMTRQTRVQGGKSVEYTKAQWLDSFDSQIKTIKEQKERSIELDNFMHSDEVKELVDRLPQDGVLEVAANFSQKTDYDNKVVPDSFMLIYEQEDLPDGKDFYKDGVENAIDVQKSDGSIDKKGIVDWLNMLYDYTKGQ